MLISHLHSMVLQASNFPLALALSLSHSHSCTLLHSCTLTLALSLLRSLLSFSLVLLSSCPLSCPLVLSSSCPLVLSCSLSHCLSLSLTLTLDLDFATDTILPSWRTNMTALSNYIQQQSTSILQPILSLPCKWRCSVLSSYIRQRSTDTILTRMNMTALLQSQ